MAIVIGPNGRPNEVPDDVAKSLVGNGERGYAYAPEPEPEPAPAPAPAPEPRRPVKRVPRKPAASK